MTVVLVVEHKAVFIVLRMTMTMTMVMVMVMIIVMGMGMVGVVTHAQRQERLGSIRINTPWKLKQRYAWIGCDKE